jgi:hypothetical protein
MYQEKLQDCVLPAIKARWPTPNQRIFIQEDNAPAHGGVLEAVFADAAKAPDTGWVMVARPQPQNSPDFNILDLGYFRAIQSLHCKNKSTCVESLLRSVHKSFDDLEWTVLDNTFLTLQTVLEQAMLRSGDNDYKILHHNKHQKRKQGSLPPSFECSAAAVEVCDAVLDSCAAL